MCEKTKKEEVLRFINTKGEPWFNLKSGDAMEIYGEKLEVWDHCIYCEVQYIDSKSFHMNESTSFYSGWTFFDYFAKWVKEENLKIVVLRKKLPEFCYTVLNDRGQIAKLTKGKEGYEIVDLGKEIAINLSYQLAFDLNNKLGVSMVQEIAMYYGAMFGWEKDGADPDFYEDTGMELYLRNLPGRKIERRRAGWTKGCKG